MKRKLIAALVAAVALADGAVMPAQAADIVDEWASVKAPPAPALKPVTVDPKTTALLMLDFMQPELRPSGRAAWQPAGDEEAAGRGARAKGVMVVYS